MKLMLDLDCREQFGFGRGKSAIVDWNCREAVELTRRPWERSKGDGLGLVAAKETEEERENIGEEAGE